MKLFKRLMAALAAFADDPDEDFSAELEDEERERRAMFNEAVKQASLELEKKLVQMLTDLHKNFPNIQNAAGAMSEILMQKENQLIDDYVIFRLGKYLSPTLVELYREEKKQIPGINSQITLLPDGKDIRILWKGKLIAHAKTKIVWKNSFAEVHMNEVIPRNEKAAP